MDQLGNKDDLTPSPKRSSSNRGCLTGETNDVVSSYGFALTEQASGRVEKNHLVIVVVSERCPSHLSPSLSECLGPEPKD
jgi:hypothetical protein